MASGDWQKELQAAMLRLVWNKAHFPHLVNIHGEAAQERFQLLYRLICEAREGKRVFEIRIVPDSAFGFLHGKGGVIRDTDGGNRHHHAFSNEVVMLERSMRLPCHRGSW